MGAVAILRTNNPLVLAIEMTMIALVVEHRSPAQGRWRRTFQALVIAAAAITIARLAVAALIPPPAVPPLVWDIPAWEPITGFRIGGPLSWATVVVGLYDSFRLTVTVAIFGAAGSTPSPWALRWRRWAHPRSSDSERCAGCAVEPSVARGVG